MRDGRFIDFNASQTVIRIFSSSQYCSYNL